MREDELKCLGVLFAATKACMEVLLEMQENKELTKDGYSILACTLDCLNNVNAVQSLIFDTKKPPILK